MSKVSKYKFIPVEANQDLRAVGIHAGPEDYRTDYPKLFADLGQHVKNHHIDKFIKTLRYNAERDFFVFAYFVLGLPLNHPYLIARCYEIQDVNHKVIDLHAREHFKSSIITYAFSLYELALDKEISIGIFSHTRDISKALLRRMKRAMEELRLLPQVWSDVFFENPARQAPKWSEDDGLFVKRSKISNEASVEAWGLTDNMPTGKHFSRLIYDDPVTKKSVKTPEQIRNTTDSYRVSLNLGEDGGKYRIIGTRWSHADSYSEIMKTPGLTVRRIPGEIEITKDGGYVEKVGGIPVFLDREKLDKKLEEQGPYVYSAQILQNPSVKSDMGFLGEWLSFWSKARPFTNNYAIIDPASSKKKGSDYTAAMVIGVDSRRNYYVLDIVRDKLNLKEKWELIKSIANDWGVKTFGYEKYGMQSDQEHFTQMMEEEGFYVNIVPLGGNQIAKHDRILSLVPDFQRGRIILPRTLVKRDWEGRDRDVANEFVVEEYLDFPYAAHDDMLDVLSRIKDPAMGITFPSEKTVSIFSRDKDYLNLREESEEPEHTWMAV